MATEPAVIDLASRMEVPDDVVFCDLEGESILLQTSSGRYFGLDETGTRMWSLLAETGRVEVVYRELLAEYEVAGDTLREDLLDLIRQLVDSGLLRLRGA